MSNKRLTIRIKNIFKKIEKKSFFLSVLHRFFMFSSIKLLGVKNTVKLKFKSRLGYKLDLSSPKTFNEKIQWLKMYYFEDFYLQSCDKYLIRDYIKSIIGFDCCPPVLFVSKKVEDFSIDKIQLFPCILKISNGSGQNLIIYYKKKYTDKTLRKMIKKMIYEANTHARYGCEPQYLKKDPYIIVEQLLLDKEGRLPNDYKLFFFNGRLEFIYCSVDRLGGNYRQLYDEDWNRLDFLLLEDSNVDKYERNKNSNSIPQPESFSEMKDIGATLSKNFPLVRIDFYDVDGKLYLGEITLHHGSGHDMFYPREYDLLYGEKLNLPKQNFTLKI